MKKSFMFLGLLGTVLSASYLSLVDNENSLYKGSLPSIENKQEYLKDLNTRLSKEHLNCKAITKGYKIIGEADTSLFVENATESKISNLSIYSNKCLIAFDLDLKDNSSSKDKEWNELVFDEAYQSSLDILSMLERVGSFSSELDGAKFFYEQKGTM